MVPDPTLSMCASFFHRLITDLPPADLFSSPSARMLEDGRGSRASVRRIGTRAIGGDIVDACTASTLGDSRNLGSNLSPDDCSGGIQLTREQEWKGVCMDVNEDDAYTYVLREVLRMLCPCSAATCTKSGRQTTEKRGRSML